MSLTNYKLKRKFAQTTEPRARKDKTAHKTLVFVIHKHAARHLHYDLRLELDGVLKSWALPKGIAQDSCEKRLAIMTEDHPYDYKNFAGVIAPGNYGAGVVEIWDSGNYIVPDANSVEEAQAIMRAGLKKGHIRFELYGEKIKGIFSLIRASLAGKENTWLLRAKKV